MESTTVNNFEQLTIDFEQPLEQRIPRWTPTVVSLELGALCMQFAKVERVPRYDNHERENDVEHSFMLSMIAPELAHHYYPDLDTRLVGEYSRVHDLIEVRTGDVATFQLLPEQLEDKEAREQAALEALVDELPPYTASLLAHYEAQADPESRFVRAVDKLLPVIVDIIGQGSRVMQEDYGVTTSSELEQSHDSLHKRIARKFGEFTLIVHAHRELCELFEAEFAA